jgi:hypothetical protein
VLEIPPSVAFPRVTATWLPESAVQLIGQRGVDAWSLVREPDGALREMYADMVPVEARDRLESLRSETAGRLEEFADLSKEIDGSLPQLVDSARGKVDYQLRRISDGLVSKVRSRFDRTHPQVGRLRHALLPQDRPQERRLTWLDVMARGGAAVLGLVSALADQHVRDTLAGTNDHHLIALGSGEGK